MIFSTKACFTFLSLIFATLVCCSCSPEAKKASHLKKADENFVAGHYDDAEIEYLNVLQIERLNPAAIAHLGIIYFEQGRIGKAVPFLFKARELQPDDIDVRLKAGMLQLALGNFKGALEEANFVLDHRPGDEDAPLLLVDASNTPEAIAAARKKLQTLDPGILARAPAQVALGTLELKERHIPEAENILRSAITENPKSDSAQAAMGMLYRTSNKLPEAELAFKRATELAKPRSARQLAYAKFKLQTGDTESARRSLEEIIAKTPDYLPPQISLAEILAAQKKYPESTVLITKILARDPRTHRGAPDQFPVKTGPGPKRAGHRRIGKDR